MSVEIASDEHFAKLLRELPSLWGNDKEEMHMKADGVITGMLKALGFPETVKAFDELEKWYS